MPAEPVSTLTYHYYSWGAKSALAAVALCDPLLGRMRLFDIPDPLDRNDMLAVDTDQRRQAGVDRGMIDLARGRIQLRHNLHQGH